MIRPLLLMLLIVLVAKFPPGTTWAWQIGSVRLVFPVGWCVLVSLVAGVVASLYGKRG